MRKVITGYLYRGQPIYEEWSDDKLELKWFSRDIMPLKEGWKFKDWHFLHAIRFEPHEKEGMSGDPEKTSRVVARVMEGRERVCQLTGVEKVV
jgi:hypothetical protein